jgi:hypothetical protein
VRFGYRDGATYPVIVVPEGVTVPVASKKELSDSRSKRLIHQNGVYFRTLNSNGVASSSLVVHADWRDLVWKYVLRTEKLISVDFCEGILVQ